MRGKNDIDRYLILSEISEPMRLKILFVIASSKEICAVDILPRLGVTQPTLSHHMNVLCECGAVIARKEGRRVYYSINESLIGTVRDLAGVLEGGDAAPVVEKAPKAKVTRTKATAAPKNDTLADEPDPGKKKKKDKKKKDKDKSKKKKK